MKQGKPGDPLAALNRHLDLAVMAKEIDCWVPRPSRVKGGPTELMNRLPVLQQLLNLSHEQMEYQLLERMGFQRGYTLPRDEPLN